jgi:hypothetical protein
MQRSIISALVVSLLLISTPVPAHADSPITSTPFSEAYLDDYDIVEKARQKGTLDLEMAQYLSSRSTPIDVKAALINALSWKFEGKQNAVFYRYYLGLTYGLTVEQLAPERLSADEQFALGYLTIMDDYFHPQKAIPLLEKAQARQPKSRTVAMITALAKAQAMMQSDWCQVWTLTDAAARNQSLRSDMRPEAQKIILDYMSGYQASCK